MPGFNQIGPEGEGAMTGWQKGMCRRTENQTFRGDGSGRKRGLGMGRGLGQGQNRGQNRNFNSGAQSSQNMTNDGSEELRDLKEQYQAAQKTLSILEEKIAALESTK